MLVPIRSTLSRNMSRYSVPCWTTSFNIPRQCLANFPSSCSKGSHFPPHPVSPLDTGIGTAWDLFPISAKCEDYLIIPWPLILLITYVKPWPFLALRATSGLITAMLNQTQWQCHIKISLGPVMPNPFIVLCLWFLRCRIGEMPFDPWSFLQIMMISISFSSR